MKLSLKDVKLRLGNNLFDYDLEINNEITGIYGESGAGKSTLLNLISGLLLPDRGSITFGDEVLFDDKSKTNIKPNKRNIAYVFQQHFLFPHKTVKENLMYSSKYVEFTKIKFDDIVELLDLERLLEKKPMELSGGEKQRTAIGRALLSQAKLLLLDEPFSSLDENRKNDIIVYLLKINSIYNIPMIIVSHDLTELLKMSSYLVLIKSGKILSHGNITNLIEDEHINSNTFDKYVNVVNCLFTGSNSLLEFEINNGKGQKVKLSKNDRFKKLKIGEKVKLFIRPKDISISISEPNDTSIQNFIKGNVINIIENEYNTLLKIDCGEMIIVDISNNSLKKLELSVGKQVYCLFKARAIECLY